MILVGLLDVVIGLHYCILHSGIHGTIAAEVDLALFVDVVSFVDDSLLALQLSSWRIDVSATGQGSTSGSCFLHCELTANTVSCFIVAFVHCSQLGFGLTLLDLFETVIVVAAASTKRVAGAIPAFAVVSVVFAAFAVVAVVFAA
jgi:hypothetical protein